MTKVNEINKGTPHPLGSVITNKGVNFSIVASNADLVEILIFEHSDSNTPKFIYKLSEINKTGAYWHAEIEGCKEGTIYAFRIYQKDNSINPDYSPKVLIDPCSRGITGWEIYSRHDAINKRDNMKSCLKSVVCERNKFDFEKYPRPKHSWKDTIIYELHVGAFTQNNLSKKNLEHKCCFTELSQQISYLKEIGVTSIELLPIFSFDDSDAPEGLRNFWGYSPINWFTPHHQYFGSASSKETREIFRQFVEECHSADIEVILDVVYNHTSEGDSRGPALSWKGIDENLYYFIDENKHFQDVTGCGNSIAANRGHVRQLILESLKCWANEFGVDGFRFDLGVALTRGENLEPLDNPPLFEDIECDPDLSEIKLISEPWDCGGLYKIKDFPSDKTHTWNGHFRDDVRKFWKADKNTAWNIRDKIMGSLSIYGDIQTYPKSINFITSHDGFTLKDLVTFNSKYNFSNKEQNRDGENDNNSYNYGVEGPSSNKTIKLLRKRQQKNFLLTLFCSRGTPMVLMGDEVGRSQGGNNNSWCQNNSLGWMSWNKYDQDLEILSFIKYLIKIRKKFVKYLNPVLLSSPNNENISYEWHGIAPREPDWSSWSHTVAFSINKDDMPLLWLGFNAYSENIKFTLPETNGAWCKVIDTYEELITRPKHLDKDNIELRNQSSILIISNNLLREVNLLT